MMGSEGDREGQEGRWGGGYVWIGVYKRDGWKVS